MKSFRDYLKEAEAQVIDGPDGMKTTINPDGTKTVSDASGTKTYDAQGQLVTTATPNFAGVQKTTDIKSGDITTDYNQGPMSASQTQTPGGYTKQKDTQYDLGTATVGQQTAGPNIAAGQLAGTTTNTVTNKQTGQAMQQIQGVGFGGASGPNVGKNYVGASTDDLVQHAANSTAGINPDDAATPVQARVAPAVSPTAPKTEKDVVDLNAKYNSKKPQAPAEDMHRLRKLSGITEKDIEEAPDVPASTTPAPKPENPPPMPPAGQTMDLTKIDNDTLFNKHQQLQSTLATMAPPATDKAAPAGGPASDDMSKGVTDQLNQAQEELKKRGYSDQQLKSNAAPAAPTPKPTPPTPAQTESKFKEDLEAMLRIARLR
jgi:hypothetical protein